MSRNTFIALGAIALLVGPTAAEPLKTPCPSGDIKACALATAQAHPIKRMPFWQPRFATPVEDRVGPAPPELIQYLALDMTYKEIPGKPREPGDHPGLLADLRAAFDDLPSAVRKRLSERLAGVYLMEDFGGSGFTDMIADASGRKVAAFTVLDANVLDKRTANEWATWKENTPFIADSRHALAATLEKPADDNRRQAIQYILLHELGHVLSVGQDFHPDWNLGPAQVPSSENDPFFNIAWTIDRAKSLYVLRDPDLLPEAKQVRYYFGAKLPAAQMAATYDHLGRTSFPTLYAATHPADDFAESFANYVHVVMMGKPFEIAILEDGKVVKRYGPCWNEPRCAAKRRILEEFLR